MFDVAVSGSSHSWKTFIYLFIFIFFPSFHLCLRGEVESNETHLHLHILAYFTSVLLLYQWHCGALLSMRRLLRPCHQEPRTCGYAWFGKLLKKPRCVWFVYVGASSLTFHSVIFRLYMSLSAAFMSPLIPLYCTGWLWTAMQVALCIKHTATGHRYHYYIHDHHSGRLIIWVPQKIHSNTCSWAHLHSRRCCF